MNEQQLEASKQIATMLMSEDRGFCLVGKAGTGKSHTLKHVIETGLEIGDKYFERHNINSKWQVQLTGPTHKSVQVLDALYSSVHFMRHKAPPCTLYSFLRLKPISEFGESKLAAIQAFNHIYDENTPLLLVVDEASMLPKVVLNYLFSILERNAGMKVLFIYDHLQLTPPKSMTIPVHDYDIPSYELTQFMRSEDSYIGKINDYLREIVRTKGNPVLNQYSTDRASFTKQVEDSFIKDPANTVLVTYTNKGTYKWNNHIHQLLTGWGMDSDERLLGEAYEYTINNKSGVLNSDTIVIKHRDFISLIGGQHIDCDIVDPEVRANKLKTLAKQAKDTKDWRDYYTYKNITPDLRLPYARTAYKVQGSTFDNVFVDLPDIMTCTHKEIRNRLLYVATSRARKNLHILKE